MVIRFFSSGLPYTPPAAGIKGGMSPGGEAPQLMENRPSQISVLPVVG